MHLVRLTTLQKLRSRFALSASGFHSLLRRNELPIEISLLTIGIAGMVARIALAWVSEGSNDVIIWRQWGTLLQFHSLTDVYSNVERFNHPPLMAWWVASALRWSQHGPLRFAVLLKLPGLLAEGVTCWLLWRIWRPTGRLLAAFAVAAFAWNLDSILVSGFHGSTDSVCAMLCLLSAAWIQQRAFFLGGLGLAAALNVKLIPLILVPTFLILAPTWRQGIRFVSALALGALPFLPFLVSAGSGFYAHAIAYNSNPDNWGVSFLLNAAEQNPRFAAITAGLAQIYRSGARYLILGICVVFGFWARWARWNSFRLSFLCLAVFLVFAPGFGVQYTVYVVPTLFAISLPQAVLYSWLSGFFILGVYFNFALLNEYPLRSQFTTAYPPPASLLGLVAWTVLIVLLLRNLASHAEQPLHR